MFVDINANWHPWKTTLFLVMTINESPMYVAYFNSKNNLFL